MRGNSPIDALVAEFIDAGGASLLDPWPVRFRTQHEAGVAPVRRLLKRGAGQAQQLLRPLTRNAFLCGCLDYTEGQSIEHLIVGYGSASGSTTDVRAIQHACGEAGRVAVPPAMEEAARRFVISEPRAELIVFHNHPRGWLNAMFDNLPLASSADRRLLVTTKYLHPFVALKSVLGRGGVRFYVGENGFVREFTTPGLLQLLALLGPQGRQVPHGPPQ